MCPRLQPHASQERLLIFEGLPAQLEVSLYAVVRDTFGWLPTPPASRAEESPPAVAAEGSTQGPWHAAALEKMRGGAAHGAGGSSSASPAAVAAAAAAGEVEVEVVRACPPHLSLCVLPSAEAEPCADDPCTDPCAAADSAADGGAEGGADSAIPGATSGTSEDAGGAGSVAGSAAGSAAALAAVRVLEAPSLRAALLVAVEAVAEVREAGVRGWAARRGVGVEQIHEALEVHAGATTRAAAGGEGAGAGEGGGSDTCDADVASLRLLLAPSPAPEAVDTVDDAGDAGDVGEAGGEGDAPLKEAAEGLHARFLLEAFLCEARREMAELQSGFDEMASQMRACGVYLGGGTQPKETKEQLKELGALKDFVGELRR